MIFEDFFYLFIVKVFVLSFICIIKFTFYDKLIPNHLRQYNYQKITYLFNFMNMLANC
jgi:hypothetical protein